MNNGYSTTNTGASAATGSNHNPAADELREVVDKAEELMASLGNATGVGMEELRLRVNKTISTAKDRLSEFDSTARDTAQRAAANTEEYVTGHPWTSVAVAAGIGAVVAAILSAGGRR